MKTAVWEAILWARCISSLLCAFPGVPKRITTDWPTLKTTEIDLTVLEVRSLKPTICVSPLSRVRLLATPWTAAYQAPPSMGFSKQDYWSGLPLPSPRKQESWAERRGAALFCLEERVDWKEITAATSPAAH